MKHSLLRNPPSEPVGHRSHSTYTGAEREPASDTSRELTGMTDTDSKPSRLRQAMREFLLKRSVIKHLKSGRGRYIGAAGDPSPFPAFKDDILVKGQLVKKVVSGMISRYEGVPGIPATIQVCEEQLRLALQQNFDINDEIVSDGDCQFDAIWVQLKLKGLALEIPNYRWLRKVAVDWLKDSQEHISKLDVLTNTATYLHNMQHKYMWGDEFTLSALAQKYNVEILVVESNPAVPAGAVDPATKTDVVCSHYICQLPEGTKPIHRLHIANYNNSHFWSITPKPFSHSERVPSIQQGIVGQN